MIENYPNQRRMHCETGVMVNLLQYYGYEISEPMVFGIGGGMYFLYFPWMKVQDFVLVVMRSKPGKIMHHFTKRMHLNFHEQTFGNDVEKATRVLDEFLAKNQPVGLASNILGLKYLNDLGFNLDYNGHHFVVIGKEGTQYIIADIDEKLPNDDYVRLEEANLRYSRFRPGLSAPHGRLFYIDPLPKDYGANIDLRPAVMDGLKEAYKNMETIPIKYFGSKGIHFMANYLRKWPKIYKQEQIDYTLLWYYRVIEQAGTGGAGYRFIFADFLKESAALLQSEALDKSSAIMRKAADSWRAFTIDCNRYINRTEVTLDDMAAIIDEAGNYEHEAFMTIKNKVLKNR